MGVEFHTRSLFVDLCRKTDSPVLGLGLLHQATDRVKHHLELPIVLVSNATSLCAKSWCVETACRRRINALMISMFTWTARSLVRTEDSMAIPCSVKTYGAYFRCFPRPVFKAPDWLLKEADSSTASCDPFPYPTFLHNQYYPMDGLSHRSH